MPVVVCSRCGPVCKVLNSIDVDPTAQEMILEPGPHSYGVQLLKSCMKCGTQLTAPLARSEAGTGLPPELVRDSDTAASRELGIS